MNARWYDPYLNRFISADTIVPDPANPQSHNRYSYALNNPLRFTDPTGHIAEEDVGSLYCYDSICNKVDDPPPLLNGVIDVAHLVSIELFLLGYDHYLPRQFIEHYAEGNGSPLYLSESDMAELGVTIDLNTAPEFKTLVDQIAANGGGTATVSFSNKETATTHGTLGVFTAYYEGDLTVIVDESGNVSWSFEGSVSFYDEWDFDPRPWGERQSTYAEVLTRIGNALLPGEGFKIYTLTTPLSQTNLQEEAVWIGTGSAPGQTSNLAVELNK